MAVCATRQEVQSRLRMSYFKRLQLISKAFHRATGSCPSSFGRTYYTFRINLGATPFSKDKQHTNLNRLGPLTAIHSTRTACDAMQIITKAPQFMQLGTDEALPQATHIQLTQLQCWLHNTAQPLCNAPKVQNKIRKKQEGLASCL